MGVRVLKRLYGNAFAPSTEPKPDWLIGNVGDWLRLNLEVEAGVEFLATQQEPVSINRQERTIKLMNGKKWNDYGFDIGQEITFKFTKKYDATITNYSTELVVEQMFNDTIVYEENAYLDNNPFDIIPTDRGIEKIYNVKFFVDKDCEGVKFKYANISNSEVESHSLKSFIDDTETEMYYNQLATLTEADGFKEMTLVGQQSGMSISGSRIRKIETEDTEPIQIIDNIGNPIFQLGTSQYFTGNPNVKKIRDAWAFPIQMQNSVLHFQSLTATNLRINTKTFNPNMGDYTNGMYTRCFFLNSPNARNYKFEIDFKFHINGTNKTDTGCYIRLVLIKYTGGDALNIGAVQELKRWNNGQFPNGLVLDYQNTITKDINIGDSFSLALEWNHDAVNTTLRYIQPVIDDVKVNVFDLGATLGSYKKRYELQVDFMLSSFFEQITDLEEGTPPNVVFDASSLTDAIKLTFLPEWNNPNIKIENNMTETERFGNTGWFNENYNGLINNFTVESLQYFDTGGQPTTGLSYGTEVKVKAVIAGINNLAVESDFKHGFIWLPIEEEQYKDKLTPFHKNTKISSHFNTTAFNANTSYPFTYEGYSNDNAKMNTRAISYTILGDKLVFEAIFSPTPEFLSYFQDKLEDRKYAIWVSVADKNLATNFSDRVSLLLDVNNMDLFVPISGELEKVTTSFLEHPETHLDAGVEYYEGFLEDDILARSFFNLDFGKKLNQVILGYEVENMATGSSFELERFTANLSSFPITPAGVHQIDYNSERGYLLKPNFNKNWVKVVRNEDGDTDTSAGYQILFAQKIRWEYWLQKNNVPSEFYDSTLEFNGSNTDWLHFLRESNDHNINFFILFDVVEAGEVKRYKNKYEIIFNDYDENENITTEHKYYNNETNELLDAGIEPETGRPMGILLSNKNTRVEITYTKVTGDFDIQNVYAVTTLEINKGAGVMTHRQLSSIVGSESDNILIPLADATKLKVEQIATNVIKTSCLVDFTKLTAGFMYKITGRIGCFPNSEGVPISQRKYDEADYEPNYE